MRDKHRPDSCERTRQILNRIGDKWSLLVIDALADVPRRHVDIRRNVSGISQKMLTVTLRLLERDGIVVRTPLDTIPLSVRYELTPLGLSLVETVRSLTKWARTHDAEIGDAHMRYDKTKEKEKTGMKLR